MKTVGLIIAISMLFIQLETAFSTTDSNPSLAHNTGQAAASCSQKLVVAYYANWAAYQGYLPEQIPAHQLTHLNYAFAKIDPATGKLALTDPSNDRRNLAAIQKLKQGNPHLKVLIAVGGWDESTYFSDVASSPSRREIFAQSCLDFILEYGLDGVDLDWEYPVSGGYTENINRPQDKQNFTLLLEAIRSKLEKASQQNGKPYVLTIAGAANTSYLSKIEPERVAGLVDYIFLMAYDMHGPWDSYTDFNAPLYTPVESSPQYKNSVYDGIQAYQNSGVSPSQIVLGTPFYGYLYQGVDSQNSGLYRPFSTAKSISYHTLQKNYLNHPAFSQFRHSTAAVPYLYGNNTFITYEDEQSLAAKVDLANSLGLAGVGVWELSHDTSGTLLQSICTALDSNWCNPFVDVVRGAWYYDAIRFVHQRKIMDGTSATTFAPNLTATRGMLVTMLHRLEGTPLVSSHLFTDVAAGAYYADAVAWATGHQIVNGYGNGQFGPEDSLTREQLASILYRYAQYKGHANLTPSDDLSAFCDGAMVSNWAKSGMSWAVEQGIIKGKDGNRLDPQGFASRSEMATIFMRLMELPTQ